MSCYFWKKAYQTAQLLELDRKEPITVRTALHGNDGRRRDREAHEATKGAERRKRKTTTRHHGGGSCDGGVPHPPRFRSGDVDPAVPQRGQDRRLLLLPPVHRLPQVYVSTSSHPNP